MEDRREPLDYTPISCDVVDHIEIYATQRKVVSLVLGNEIEQFRFSSKIVTWFTRDKVEYMTLSGGYVVRLDRLIEIDGISARGTMCKV